MKSEEFATARLAKLLTLSMCFIDDAKVLHSGGACSAEGVSGREWHAEGMIRSHRIHEKVTQITQISQISLRQNSFGRKKNLCHL